MHWASTRPFPVASCFNKTQGVVKAQQKVKPQRNLSVFDEKASAGWWLSFFFQRSYHQTLEIEVDKTEKVQDHHRFEGESPHCLASLYMKVSFWMGFSLTKTIQFGIHPWLWKPHWWVTNHSQKLGCTSSPEGLKTLQKWRSKQHHCKPHLKKKHSRNSYEGLHKWGYPKIDGYRWRF